MREEIILYHGSKNIVESPEIRVTKYNKDFYFGFYCTTLDAQAKRWATRFDGKGILNEYRYTPNEELSVKVFPEMSEEWLDFIVACRSGKSHNYDIVEGQWRMIQFSTMCRILLTAKSAEKLFGIWQGLKSLRIR